MSFLTDNITELLVAGILVVVALAVMTGTANTQANATITANASLGTQPTAYLQGITIVTSIGGFATWFPLLVLVAVAVIILYRIGMFSGQKTGF